MATDTIKKTTPREFKETKIGSIPNDWDCVRLEDAAEVILSNVDKKMYEGQKPVFLCNYTDVYYNKYITKAIDFMKATASEREIERFSLLRGDVVITKDSEDNNDIAVPALVTEKLANVLCGYHLAIIRPNKKKLLGAFFSKYLELHPVRHYFSTLANGVTRFGLSDQAIRHSFVFLPSLPEQERISGILSEWDAAIEKIERLISAKQKLKKALCQQLLTGKKRPRGFSSRWKQSQLSNLAEIIVSNVDKKINSHETPVLLCNYLDVYRNHYITNQLNFMEGRATKTEIEKFKLQMDDVIITKDSETPDDIAKAATVTENLKNVLCGYHLAILRPKQDVLSGLYLGQYLMLPSVRYQFTRVANGATRFGLAVSSIEEVVIDYPTFDEQQKIAEILTNCDNEIELLNCKVELMKHQKRGLMQKLLTGKIRVKT